MRITSLCFGVTAEVIQKFLLIFLKSYVGMKGFILTL